MTKKHTTWFFACDRKVARLLEATPTPHGRLHVDEAARVEEEWDELEHGRPSPRASKEGHSYASRGHEVEERLHRFAKAIVEWAQHELDSRAIESATLFAPPRLLGQVRGLLPAKLKSRLETQERDLARLSTGDLAKHEAVVALAPVGK